MIHSSDYSLIKDSLKMIGTFFIMHQANDPKHIYKWFHHGQEMEDEDPKMEPKM